MGIGDRSAAAQAAVAPNPVAPVDPTQKLADLQKTLDTNKSTIDDLTLKNNNLLTDIAALQKGLGEAKQSSQAYTQAYPAIVKDVQDLSAYLAIKTKLIEGALSQADKDAIQQKVAASQKSIDDQNGQLQANQKSRDDAAAKLQDAQSALAVAQANYNRVQGALKSLQDQLKEMKATRDAVEKEEQAQHLRNTSYLVGVLKTEMDSFQPMSTDQYQAALQRALADTHPATQAVREAKTALETSQAAVDATQKTLDTLQSSRRDTLLKTLEAPAQAARA